jgi:hypothetical protein
MDADTAVKLHALGENFSMLSRIAAVQLGPALLSLVEILFSVVAHLKGAAAFFGAATSRMDFSSWIKSAFGNREGGSRTLMDVLKKFDPAAGAVEWLKAESEFLSPIQRMREQLAEEAKNIGAGPAPSFDIAGGVEKAKRMKEGDSLIRVGNFLGSTGNAINRLETQKVQLLTNISNNTLALAQHAKNSVTDRFSGSGGVGGAMFPP